MRGNNKKRAAVDPSCHLRARELSDSGTKTAAPNQVLQERVRTRGPSAEEAESRPSCELVLCNFLLINVLPVCRGWRYLFRKRHPKMLFRTLVDYNMRLKPEDVNGGEVGCRQS
jgi:hypothetical protein